MPAFRGPADIEQDVVFPQGVSMRRREFIKLLGGVVVSWPLVARAQDGRLRRAAILMTLGENDTEGQRRVNAFVQSMQELGWIEGQNIIFEKRWGAGDAERS